MAGSLLAIALIATSCGGNQKSALGDSAAKAKTEASATAAAVEGVSSIADNKNFKVTDRNMIVPVNGRPAVVDFGAEWCPPCQKLKPIFAKLAKEYEGRIDFVSVDVDANEALARNYVGQGIPTLAFLLPDGNVAGKFEGFLGEDQLRAYLDDLIEMSKQQK